MHGVLGSSRLNVLNVGEARDGVMKGNRQKRVIGTCSTGLFVENSESMR